VARSVALIDAKAGDFEEFAQRFGERRRVFGERRRVARFARATRGDAEPTPMVNPVPIKDARLN
jgi:hypothetical protein